MSNLESLARLVVGFACLGAGGLSWIISALLVFPSHRARAWVSNLHGRLLGGLLVKITGSDVDVQHRARLCGPAIFVSNHTSLIDVLLAAWLVPPFTISLGKREILKYPVVGQMFWLSGSVAVDRDRSSKADNKRSALHELAQRLVERRLGVIMFPEGTRAADHSLGKFHVGFARLSQLTGLDVVPIVVHDAYKAWPRKTLRLNPTQITVDVMERIPASTFAEGTDLTAAAEDVRAAMAARLNAPWPAAPDEATATGYSRSDSVAGPPHQTALGSR